MNFIEKLNYIKTIKQNIYQSILNKGVDIHTNDSFNSYADKITSIDTQGYSDSASVVAPGLIFYFDAITNAVNYTHSDTTNCMLYPVVAEGQSQLVSSQFVYNKHYKPLNDSTNLKWGEDYLHINGNNGYLPYNCSRTTKYPHGRMQDAPSGVTYEAVISLYPSYSNDMTRDVVSNQESGGAALYLYKGTNEIRFQPYTTAGYITVKSEVYLQSGPRYFISGRFKNNEFSDIRVVCPQLGLDQTKRLDNVETLLGFSNAPITIGYNPNSYGYPSNTETSAGYFKDGIIHAVRIYDRCLTSTEVNNNLAYDSARFNLMVEP